MRTLVITEHPEFGKVRTVEAGGRVWFCARDVASALGYANPKDAVNRHCRPKGVCVHDLLTAGGRQKVKFIDEGNLYRLMACSRLPSAERFESWIFDELVPRTLKEGGYLLEKEGETDAELLSRTLQLAEAKLKERDRYISGLEKENALNALKLSLQAPKVRYFDEVLHSPSTYTVTQIAKELGMSGRELNRRLKALGIQFRLGGTWLLTARYQKEGYTRTHTHSWQSRCGETGTAMHTVWTEKGRLFIHCLFSSLSLFYPFAAGGNKKRAVPRYLGEQPLKSPSRTWFIYQGMSTEWPAPLMEL